MISPGGAVQARGDLIGESNKMAALAGPSYVTETVTALLGCPVDDLAERATVGDLLGMTTSDGVVAYWAAAVSLMLSAKSAMSWHHTREGEWVDGNEIQFVDLDRFSPPTPVSLVQNATCPVRRSISHRCS